MKKLIIAIVLALALASASAFGRPAGGQEMCAFISGAVPYIAVAKAAGAPRDKASKFFNETAKKQGAPAALQAWMKFAVDFVFNMRADPTEIVKAFEEECSKPEV